MQRREPYLPIAEYALIGNRHTCALVARDGSIDWCCLPHLDDHSVFAAILDARRGGHWRVSPTGHATATRRYLAHSAVLETEFRTGGGMLRVRDFLPIRRGRGNESSRSTESIVRSVLCIEGEVEVEVDWRPRPDYGRDDVVLTMEAGVVWARSAGSSHWLAGLPAHAEVLIEHASASTRLRLQAAAGLDLIGGYGNLAATALLADVYLDETLQWWEEWAARCRIPPGA